jgi:hypothetical protein
MVEVQPMPPPPMETPEEPMEKTMSVAEVCEAIVNLKGRLQTDAATGKVTTVWLNRTSARDDDMKMLRFLPDLTVLNITGTFISDSGLEHLHEVKSLRRIYLARTKGTERGIAQLREAIPELRIMLLTSAP